MIEGPPETGKRASSPRYRRDVGGFDPEHGDLLDGLFVDQNGFGEEPCRFDGVGEIASNFPGGNLGKVYRSATAEDCHGRA